MSKISPIIQPEELLKLKVQNKDFILIDADGGGKERYLANHLDGAYFVDLETDLSAAVKDAANGGRHPLPSTTAFAETISKLGIGPKSHVVIYDDKNGSNAAARFWWMLTAIGYENVQVLSGGFKAAMNVGFPSNADLAIPKPTQIDVLVSDWKLPLATINDVAIASKTNKKIIVDVRAKNRYDGLVEPLDLVAGHIPNAINIPLTDNLDELGSFKTPNILNKKYSEAFKNISPENLIVHCGSGVTACHTLLAFAYAGLPIPSLYVGSWSEWSRSGNEMVLKNG
ncbi:MAG: sulfurtransferase [Pedobacter sp.]|uniref:sulfurtransferase n=1 Tax=Pedobacter sp. TaxID=1411316 RepID=UPI00280866F6|nr:sulfurtransferase [Pedobacter sp.]MDQ8003652.1 sulfurtransferase [Pedobacter sp.]